MKGAIFLISPCGFSASLVASSLRAERDEKVQGKLRTKQRQIKLVFLNIFLFQSKYVFIIDIVQHRHGRMKEQIFNIFNIPFGRYTYVYTHRDIKSPMWNFMFIIKIPSDFILQ